EGPGLGAIDLNQRGSYVHWSIFDISVANLVLIAVMVVIFGAALLLPFPGRHRAEPPQTTAGTPDLDSAVAAYMGDPADAKMWTARVRRWGGGRRAPRRGGARRAAAHLPAREPRCR